MKTTARGFTLIELLVTMTVAAILAVIAVPSFSAMLAASRLNQNAQDLLGVLTAARSQAILHRQGVQVSFDPDNSKAWLPTDDVTWKDTAPAAIVFRSNGTLAAARNNLTLCDGKQSKAIMISVSLLGRASSHKGECS